MLGDYNEHMPNAPLDVSISSTMDYYGGMASGVFGLTFVAALMPLSEALFVGVPKPPIGVNGTITSNPHTNTTTERSIQPSYFGRSARIITGACFAVMLFWVVLSPVNGAKLKDLVSIKTREKWRALHYIFAVLFVIAVVVHSAAVMYDNCYGEDAVAYGACGIMQYFGLGMVILGTISMLSIGFYFFMSPIAPPIVHQLFAASEYLIALSIPFTELTRFEPVDFEGTSLALIAWMKGHSGNATVIEDPLSAP